MSMTMRAVRHAQDGDRDALVFLYARYADDVYGYVRGGVHDRHEAEELTQQVFVALAGAIGDYEEREIQFSVWVMSTARRLVRERDCERRLTTCGERVHGMRGDVTMDRPVSDSFARSLGLATCIVMRPADDLS